MNRNYFFAIAAVAIACLFLIAISMWRSRKVSAPIEEKIMSTRHYPFRSFLFGVGLVESSQGNIMIGSPLERIVDKIPVTVGMKVKKGEELIKFENSDLQADLVIQQLAYQQAQANVKKLAALPRKEDLQSAEADFKSAEIELEQTQSQYQAVQNLKDIRALSQEEAKRRASAYEIAQAKVSQAQANLDKIKGGAWKPDFDIAQLEAMQARANVMRAKSNIQRTVIKSPIDGTILQIKIHEGEVPSLDASKTPLMVVGNIDDMDLKVSINQFDVPSFHSEAPAVAFLQGNSQIEFPLEFVRIEPILVNKQSWTNDILEKVDTPVLNVIYRIKNNAHPIYVGQQMDVYIERKTSQESKDAA